MIRNNIIAIVATSARSALEELKPTAKLTKKVNKAMAATVQHWLTTNEDERFLGAMAAVFEKVSSEEQERLVTEIKALRALTEHRLPDLPEGFKPIGLLKAWNKAKERKA